MQTSPNTDVPKQSTPPPPKKPPWYRRSVRLSGQLLLLGLALGGLTLLWLLVRPSGQQPPTSAAQVATATSSPTATARPTAVPSPTVQTVTVGGYTFGLPKLVTETKHFIDIAQWIDGSDHELLVRSATEEEFTVNIFDTEQGSLRRIASSPQAIGERPVWLPTAQEAAYLAYDKTDKQTNLYLSQNQSRSARLLREGVIPPIVPSGNGQDVVTLGKQRRSLQTTNSTTRQLLKSFSVNELFPISSLGVYADYQAAWTDQHDWIAYYNREQFLLVNPKTEEVQDVSLGTIDIGSVPVELQASCGQWSPDGQTLALIVGARHGQPGYFTQFALFDLATLQTQLIEIAATHITDLAWSPDGRQVLVQARVGKVEGFGLIEWLLVEIGTEQVQPLPILPNPAALASPSCSGLVWSPKGNFIFGTFSHNLEGQMLEWYRIEAVEE